MSDILDIQDKHDGIFQLCMDDSKNTNQLTPQLCDALAEALAVLKNEPSLKVLIMRGRADVFCSGAPLNVLREICSGNVQVKDLSLPGQLLAFPLPIVAALEGHAVGGGLIVAICCDIVVAAEESRYGVNFADLGFTPGMGSTGLLPLLVGSSFATEMMTTAQFYKGRDLRDRGLFTHIVPAKDVFGRTQDIAQRMAEKPRHVLMMIKDAMAMSRRSALDQAVSREHLMHQICFEKPATREIIESNYLRNKGSNHGS